MGKWQLQDAKARLSEVIATATKQGPQVITQRGVETAVIVPIEEWRRTAIGNLDGKTNAENRRPSLLEILQSGPQFEIPDRRKERRKEERERMALIRRAKANSRG